MRPQRSRPPDVGRTHDRRRPRRGLEEKSSPDLVSCQLPRLSGLAEPTTLSGLPSAHLNTYTPLVAMLPQILQSQPSLQIHSPQPSEPANHNRATWVSLIWSKTAQPPRPSITGGSTSQRPWLPRQR